jgi:hypothetical protein
MRDDLVLLTDWAWIALEYLARRGALSSGLWVFRSKRAADQARRRYGRGVWRSMAIVFVAR